MEREYEYKPNNTWVAYAKARIEGTLYYYSYKFEVPNAIYDKIVDAVYYNKPISSLDCYDDIVSCAEAALQPRQICGFEEEFLSFNEIDGTDKDYGSYIMEYNSDKKRVNCDVFYIRIFDPKAKNRFLDLLYSLDHGDEKVSHDVEYTYHAISDGEYSWSVHIGDAVNGKTFSGVKHWITSKDDIKYLNGPLSIYPPYEELEEAVKSGDVYIEVKSL